MSVPTPGLPGPHVLIVCTANQCRSPLAEAIALDLCRRADRPLRLGSAGTRAVDGAPATDGAIATARKLGLDLTGHTSRRVTADLVGGSDLILGMVARHVTELVGGHGAELARTYTLPELARLAVTNDPREPDESFSQWLRRLNDGRSPTDALAAEEIDDPIGRSMRRYRAAAELISTSLSTVTAALWAVEPRRPSR